ncbi:hypothetical protein PROVRUST_07764 [Providencia rustigianii DSM 4541]|uniref:Uncharacterized protein n=1 Tax=Providencia rustigianii DSM 4541 TaxID=500637 RepID=D1P698_9GAMM|nr:hypothetical protein PROVRUST_07764 [Providencia rustigianii DSM 4541]
MTKLIRLLRNAVRECTKFVTDKANLIALSAKKRQRIAIFLKLKEIY